MMTPRRQNGRSLFLISDTIILCAMCDFYDGLAPTQNEEILEDKCKVRSPSRKVTGEGYIAIAEFKPFLNTWCIFLTLHRFEDCFYLKNVLYNVTRL
ncbi:hypothetical protein [Nostoc sp.]|uniref:hypothetical protein n=1 Tax=Nostoc sp. TaxID=1180 RepID=UPI002FFAB94B